jgi:hypothetical protein
MLIPPFGAILIQMGIFVKEIIYEWKYPAMIAVLKRLPCVRGAVTRIA